MVRVNEIYEVQRETFSGLRDEIYALIDRVPNTSISPERCAWLYEHNPAGPAVLWTLRRNSELVGYTVAVPRLILIEGREARGWIGADFLIDPTCRTLGPALKLRRAARDAIDSGEADLLYSFPNKRMTAIHSRVGHVALGTLERLVLPLRAGPKINRLLGVSHVTNAATRAADFALRLRQLSKQRRRKSMVSCSAEPTFDDGFDNLFARAATQHQVVGSRGSAYLQWRFNQNPHYRSSLFLSALEDRLMGYLVLSRDGNTFHIRDLFVDSKPEITRDLCMAAIETARISNAASLTISLMSASPQYAILKRLGFVSRDSSDEIFAYASSGTIGSAALQRTRWHLLLGDRDV